MPDYLTVAVAKQLIASPLPVIPRPSSVVALMLMLDTGMPRHRDLVVEGSRSFISGYLEDTNGHATAVGGILSGVSRNGGVAGIAPMADTAGRWPGDSNIFY